jgi:hypothetical protein
MPMPTPTCACEGRATISGSIRAVTKAKYLMCFMVIPFSQIATTLSPTVCRAFQVLLSLKAPVYLNSLPQKKLQLRFGSFQPWLCEFSHLRKNAAIHPRAAVHFFQKRRTGSFRTEASKKRILPLFRQGRNRRIMRLALGDCVPYAGNYPIRTAACPPYVAPGHRNCI